MSVALLGFITIVIFIIHEFEEIICFKCWIQKHKNDKKYQKHLLIRCQWAYLSTQTIAIIIFEEFLLMALFLSLAIILNSYEIGLAVVIVNAFHLAGHIIDAIHYKALTPGSKTAIFTLLANISLIIFIFCNEKINLLSLFILVFFFGILAAVNLLFMQKNAGWIEHWRTK
ncbi:MAG: HXXEE domain-containing protein [Bifidobacteriaceae bacterium]|jgi:hypothetical protein|nr:HXXEE domain-containing protein [Bifidobacteriaceae bacterium]